MFRSHRRRTTVLLLVPAAVAGASLAGCSTSADHPAAGSPSASKGAAAAPFNAVKLRGALLTRVNGMAAEAPAASGDYASLTEQSTGKQTASHVRVTPKACAQATQTGFNPAVLAGSPAAAVTFKVGTNGVSETLVAPSGSSASGALAGHLPASCAHYRETVDGKTFAYTVTEAALKGIGEEARLLNVRSSAGTADDLWSLAYRGTGFVGSVTVVGPNASQAAVRELGQQAYAYAVKSLSGIGR